MECDFHLQDPTSPDTIYLFEAIIGATHGASSCEGLFAFASRSGVDSLIGDPDIQDFLGRSKMVLVIGVDAVTDHHALVRLREFERQHEGLKVRVFRNPTSSLFHPKVARFDYPNGSRTMIVGSGNLTPGGLVRNFEAFSVMRSGPGELPSLSSWDRFFADHAPDIRAIDEEVLEHAARNVMRGRPRRRDIEPEHDAPLNAGPATSDDEPLVGHTDRFLVARVPRAGDRWRQIHFNREVIDRFFHVRTGTAQRVYLVECRQDGTFAEQEVRPCVYSPANKNLKIEIGSHHGVPYPEAGPPIAVYRELQTRSFAYMLLMPGDPGYRAMSALTENLEPIGHGALRVVTDSGAIREAWAGCPLVTAIDTLPDPSN